jgi:hypothetical protein
VESLAWAAEVGEERRSAEVTDREERDMGEQSSNGQAGPVSAAVALAKDIFALLRDSSLFAVAFLLLAFPATFNAILTSAGFEEGSFAGLKWKRQLFDTDTSLRTAQETIVSLRAQKKIY